MSEIFWDNSFTFCRVGEGVFGGVIFSGEKEILGIDVGSFFTGWLGGSSWKKYRSLFSDGAAA